MKATDMLMKVLAMIALVGTHWSGFAELAIAQETTEAPAAVTDTNVILTRFPAEGLAILDCAPVLPAPPDSCILRVPPNRTLLQIEKEETGEAKGDFEKETDLSRISADLRISKTMVLIDLTPGLGGERKRNWPQERALILDLVSSLPSGQPIALYGFDENLERLTDFTTDRDLLEQTVKGLELHGSNTRIATNARDAIILMGAQEDSVLRNLVIISDGQEEGTLPVSEVTKAAVEHGVTVSTFGLFWRAVGAPQNGAGRDLLAALSAGSLGATGGVEVAQTKEAQAGLVEFVSGVNGAITSSGLIVPRGKAVEADITVILSKPRAGEPGVFDEERATARFTPLAMRNSDSKVTPAAAGPAWYEVERMGYPLLWWLISAGILTLSLLAAVVFVLRRRASSSSVDEDLPPLIAEPVVELAAQAAPPPSSRALAYLVRSDTGERLAVRKSRVTIGRSETCDLVVADPSVSRLHAELERRGSDSFALTDSGSLNKTQVNGKVISETRALKPGDAVSFGEVLLRFTLA